MHLIDPAADGELLAELKEFGILNPDTIGRIDLSLGRPESGTLNDLLMAGDRFIPEKDWLSWLIRRHGCHRFGRVAWRPEASAWARPEMAAEHNLTYRQTADGRPIEFRRPQVPDLRIPRATGRVPRSSRRQSCSCWSWPGGSSRRRATRPTRRIRPAS